MQLCVWRPYDYVLNTIDLEETWMDPGKDAIQRSISSQCGTTLPYSREKKRPSQGLIQRGPRNDRNPKALANEDLHRQWTQHCDNTQEQQRGNGTQLLTKSAGRNQKTRIRFSKAKTVTGAFSRTGIRHEDREFTVDSGASMHMLSKSDFIQEEKESIRKSKESCTFLTANEMITTTEEATVYVKDLDTLITVQ